MHVYIYLYQKISMYLYRHPCNALDMLCTEHKYTEVSNQSEVLSFGAQLHRKRLVRRAISHPAARALSGPHSELYQSKLSNSLRTPCDTQAVPSYQRRPSSPRKKGRKRESSNESAQGSSLREVNV